MLSQKPSNGISFNRILQINTNLFLDVNYMTKKRFYYSFFFNKFIKNLEER